MRIHSLQHVSFEGPAGIEHWATSRGHSLTATKFYENDELPDLGSLDWLILMGGPMSVYDDDKYPWLVQEKLFIQGAIESGKTVIGICLGAQLIADVLGAKVCCGKYKEIGWFPIQLTQEAKQSAVFGFLPERMTVFHWHGDTFSLPAGAKHLAWSDGCENQAFLYNDSVLGLQFHLEVTEESVRQIVQNSANEVVQAKYVQGAEEMLATRSDTFHRINDAMFGILDRLPK
jgi:GMP synthase (glutamine-hydrolysing)